MTPSEKGGRIVDAILTANDCLTVYYEENEKTSGGIEPPLFLFSSRKGLKKKGLIEIAGERAGVSISAIRTQAVSSGSQFYGTMLRYADRAEIGYIDSVNRCWARFVIAKELSHILIGEDDNYTQNPIELIDELRSGAMVGAMIDHGKNDVHIEHAALFGAIELLLPRRYSEIYDELLKMPKGTDQVADKFKVPEVFVAARFSKGIRQIFSQCYQAIQD